MTALVAAEIVAGSCGVIIRLTQTGSQVTTGHESKHNVWTFLPIGDTEGKRHEAVIYIN